MKFLALLVVALVATPLYLFATDPNPVTLPVRRYDVPAYFFGLGTTPSSQKVLQFLLDQGLTFPPNSTVQYDPAQSRLWLRNSEDNQQLMATMLQIWRQAVIAARRQQAAGSWDAAIAAERERNREHNSQIRTLGTSPEDALLNSPGPVGDIARRSAKYPPLPGEWPAETEVRRSLLELRDKAKANGTLTPELEFKIASELAQFAAAVAGGRQQQADRDEAAKGQQEIAGRLSDLQREMETIREFHLAK